MYWNGFRHYDNWKLASPEDDRGTLCPVCGAYSVRQCEMLEETGGVCPWEESEPDPDYLRDMRIFEKLTTLLTLLMEESWHPESSRASSLKKKNLQEIKDFLDLHYTEKINLEDLSEKFYINKFYLTRIFREQFGTTVNSYVLQLKITHAKQLLRFSDQTIEEIARACGITDPNYFSRIFRKIEGMTPGKYRRQWRTALPIHTD